jgi:hypothetical protein
MADWHMVLLDVFIVAGALFAGWAFGFRHGAVCQRDILDYHRISGMDFDRAIRYERAVAAGKLPPDPPSAPAHREPPHQKETK